MAIAPSTAPGLPRPTISRGTPTISAPRTGPAKPPPPSPSRGGVPVFGGRLNVDLPNIRPPKINLPAVTIGHPAFTLGYAAARAGNALGREMGSSLMEQLRRSRLARPQPIAPFRIGPISYSGGTIPGLVPPAGSAKPTSINAAAKPDRLNEAYKVDLAWQAAYDAQEAWLNLYNRGEAQAAVASALLYGDEAPLSDGGGGGGYGFGGGGGGGSRNAGFALGLTNWRI